MNDDRSPLRVRCVREDLVAPFADRISDDVTFRLSPASYAPNATVWNRQYDGGFVQVPSETAPRIIPPRSS